MDEASLSLLSTLKLGDSGSCCRCGQSHGLPPEPLVDSAPQVPAYRQKEWSILTKVCLHTKRF